MTGAYPLVRSIQRATAEHFGLGPRDLLSRTQLPHIARPRQVAMFLSKRRTRHSHSNLGRFFERDRTTIRHGCRQVERLIAADPGFAAKVSDLEARL